MILNMSKTKFQRGPGDPFFLSLDFESYYLATGYL
jgi:hypothetical protein